MNESLEFKTVQQVADAVLYEGYVLYPYRASAVKNRQRWNFGGLFPPAFCEANRGSDACTMQTECLVECANVPDSAAPPVENPPVENPSVEIKVRFLQISLREVGRVLSTDGPEPRYELLDSAVVDGQTIHTWQEAIERDVSIEPLSLSEIADQPVDRNFTFAADRKFEMHETGATAENGGSAAAGDAVVVVRRQQRIDGRIEISADKISERLFRLRVVVQNATPMDAAASAARDEAALDAMASTHVILACRQGEFVSLMDPPQDWSGHAAACQNVGAWPVLVGTEPQREFMLASPIILYDYPQIAPESAGPLFDGTEIDEILTLRILSLTDEEKQEMRSLDDRTRAILERTENLPPDQLAKLHGAIRGLREYRPHEEDSSIA